MYPAEVLILTNPSIKISKQEVLILQRLEGVKTLKCFSRQTCLEQQSSDPFNFNFKGAVVTKYKPGYKIFIYKMHINMPQLPLPPNR